MISTYLSSGYCPSLEWLGFWGLFNLYQNSRTEFALNPSVKPLSCAICIGLGKTFIKLPCGHKDSWLKPRYVPALVLCLTFRLLPTSYHIGQESGVYSSERFSIHGPEPTSSGDRSVVMAATCKFVGSCRKMASFPRLPETETDTSGKLKRSGTFLPFNESWQQCFHM